MKKTFFTLLLITYFLSARANDYVGILVTKTDGTTTVVSLSEKPIIKITGENLIIETEMSTTAFERSSVSRFNYLSDLIDAIDEINTAQKNISQNGNYLFFNNLIENSSIKIYNIDGVLIKDITATGNYTLNISEYSIGVYIVNINGTSTKIIIKQ